MFYTRCVTWFALYSTQDHQKISLFTSVAAISLQVQHVTCVRYGISTSVCGQCIQPGSIWGNSCMFYTRCVAWFVLYSTQDHQKSSCFTSVTATSLQVQHDAYMCDMAYIRQCVANVCSWDRFRAAHAYFIPAVKPDLRYVQLKTIRRAHIMLLFHEHIHHSLLHLHAAFGSTNHCSSRVPPT